MTPRLKQNWLENLPAPIRAMQAVEGTIRASGIEPRLLDLIRLRASQINGCAFCIHMHVTEARQRGESDMRLHLLDAWRESPLYTERERAALAWTETLTRIAETHAPDADYAPFAAQFSEEEQIVISMAIGTINAWNRLQIGFRASHPVEKPARVA